MVPTRGFSRRGLAKGTRTTLALLSLLAAADASEAHERVRRPLRVPDIPGYRTLQCDFHTHTVFSDGQVWPEVRAEEAWREGLDGFLQALVGASVIVENPRLRVLAGQSVYVRLRNESDLRLELVDGPAAGDLVAPRQVTVGPRGTSLLELSARSGAVPGRLRLELPYTIRNLLTAPDTGLPYALVLEVEIVADPAAPLAGASVSPRR